MCFDSVQMNHKSIECLSLVLCVQFSDNWSVWQYDLIDTYLRNNICLTLCKLKPTTLSPKYRYIKSKYE